MDSTPTGFSGLLKHPTQAKQYFKSVAVAGLSKLYYITPFMSTRNNGPVFCEANTLGTTLLNSQNNAGKQSQKLYSTIADFGSWAKTENQQPNSAFTLSYREQKAVANTIRNQSSSKENESFSPHSTQQQKNESKSRTLSLRTNAQKSTSSSEIINLKLSDVIHYPPVPFESEVPVSAVRNEVLRRNSLYGGSLNSFNNFMEERLIRWRPSISCNNVDDTLSDRHIYQRLQLPTITSLPRGTTSNSQVTSRYDTAEVGPSNNLFSRFALTFTAKAQDQPEESFRRIDEESPVGNELQKSTQQLYENVEEFSTQQVNQEYQQVSNFAPHALVAGRPASGKERVPANESNGSQSRAVEAQNSIVRALPFTEKDLYVLFPEYAQTLQEENSEDSNLSCSEWCSGSWNWLTQSLQCIFRCG